MNGRTKRLPVSGLCATRQHTKTAVTVISQPRPSWKVGLVTLVAEPATTRVGNSIGTARGHGGSSRNVTGFGRAGVIRLTRDWQLRCRVNRQLSPSV